MMKTCWRHLFKISPCKTFFEHNLPAKKCLDKKGQTQIRLLLKKQSDQGLPYLLLWQEMCEFQPWNCNQHFIWEQKEKSVRNFRTFTVLIKRVLRHLQRVTATFYLGEIEKTLDWLQSLKQIFINVSYHIPVASLTLRTLKTGPSELDRLQVYGMTHRWKFVLMTGASL